MPLELLLPLVVGGIAGIAILLHLLGLSRVAKLGDDAAAHAAWDREMGDDPARAVTRSRDGHAALIETASGRRGLVFPVGEDTTARYLDGARITRLSDGLRIDLPDFTAPRVRLALDESEASRWVWQREDPA